MKKNPKEQELQELMTSYHSILCALRTNTHLPYDILLATYLDTQMLFLQQRGEKAPREAAMAYAYDFFPLSTDPMYVSLRQARRFSANFPDIPPETLLQQLADLVTLIIHLRE